MDEGQVKKEATIQDLSNEMKGMLHQYKMSLHDRFKRHPETSQATSTDKVPTEPPQPDNVLDEIIIQLQDNLERFKYIIDLTEQNVFPKIS